MSDFLENIWIGLLAVGVVVGVLAALSFIYAIGVYFLWNWLMPELFGLPSVTFLQALGLTLLSSLLFRSSSSSSSSKK